MKNRREKNRAGKKKDRTEMLVQRSSTIQRSRKTEGNISGDSKTTGQIFLSYLDLNLG